MIITILRHGEAGHAATDRERCLTAKGQRDIPRAACRLEELCQGHSLPAPTHIVYSPWERTLQTAAFCAECFGAAEMQVSEALACDSDFNRAQQQVFELAEAFAPEAHLLLVSHQPLVSELLSFYLGDAGAVAPLIPGAFATFSCDVAAASCGSLRFAASPPEYE